ncbi:hypothetical protein [Microlunatus speluncae]|uniref:hypothetical protein n=1 Tax=Microlunatus speluncae TaxID=2594267 RepID=UPI0012664046|nr:hypothetical protein [Microlunatus speluncae]
MITRARITHLAVIIVGLLIMAYPFTLGAAETLTCRGVPMTPGSTCLKADGSAAESYADRISKAAVARPIVVGAGGLLAVFGGFLLIKDVRRRRDAVAH